MSAKCRVCHRPLKNAAHIAAGVGPICAQREARRASVTDGAAKAQTRATYPAERLARIERNVARLSGMLETPWRWSNEDRDLIWHWYLRWRAIQNTARRIAWA